MSRYYYFAATLPALQFGALPPMGSDEYLERCRSHLRSREFAAVEAALCSSSAAAPPRAAAPGSLLGRYYGWEWSLRNELVRLRARRLDRAPEPWLRPVERDETGVRAAHVVFQASSPLEAELLLERQRWDAIEAFKALHYFDLEYLVAYRLELQILARVALLRAEQGEDRYRDTYAAVLAAAPTSAPGVAQ